MDGYAGINAVNQMKCKRHVTSHTSVDPEKAPSNIWCGCVFLQLSSRLLV